MPTSIDRTLTSLPDTMRGVSCAISLTSRLLGMTPIARISNAVYLWIPQSPAQTDAIIRESSPILLFFGVVETKKFEAYQMVLTVSIARAF
jgi:hypothetical protein